MEKLVSLRAASMEFGYESGKTQAVRGVSFDIHKGESLAITGSSGCGKTTLLNMLGLVLLPTSGSIDIEGNDVGALSGRKRAIYRNQYFGYVYQEFALVESYTVYQNIEIPLMYAKPRLSAKTRKDRIMAAIEAVDLAVKRNERVRNLSGGQRQRVAIARAMVNTPKIILADEPTGALDSDTGAAIMALLIQYVADGKTLVMVTHDKSLAEKCTRRFIMKDGMFINEHQEHISAL